MGGSRVMHNKITLTSRCERWSERGQLWLWLGSYSTKIKRAYTPWGAEYQSECHDWFGTSYVDIRLVPFLKPKTKTQEWQPKHVLAVFCQNLFWLPKVLVTVLFPRILTVATGNCQNMFWLPFFFLVTKTNSGSQLPTRKCNRTLVDSEVEGMREQEASSGCGW